MTQTIVLPSTPPPGTPTQVVIAPATPAPPATGDGLRARGDSEWQQLVMLGGILLLGGAAFAVAVNARR